MEGTCITLKWDCHIDNGSGTLLVVNDAKVRAEVTRGARDFPLLQFDYGVRGSVSCTDDPFNDGVVPLPHQSRTGKAGI